MLASGCDVDSARLLTAIAGDAPCPRPLALALAMFIGSFSWSRVVRTVSTFAIGAINRTCLGASFIGPVLATAVLALAPPWVFDLVLSALGFAAVPVAMWRRPASPSGA